MLDQFLFSLLFSLSLKREQELERARGEKKKKKPPPPRPRCPVPTAPPFPQTPLAMMHRCQLTSQIVRARARGLYVAWRGGVKIVDEHREKKLDGVEFFFPPLSSSPPLAPINSASEEPPSSPYPRVRFPCLDPQERENTLALSSGGHFQIPGGILLSRGGNVLMPAN